MKKKILIILIAVCLLLGLSAAYYFLMYSPIKDTVSLEAGTVVEPAAFVKKDTTTAAFADTAAVDAIDVSAPGSYEVTLTVGGRDYVSTLVIEDTIAPQATALKAVAFVGGQLNPADCVTDIVDATAVSLAFSKEPDLTQAGETSGQVLLTDAGGNETAVDFTATVVLDDSAPVMTGVADKQVFLGDTISYKEDVAVTDDWDDSPELIIDNSQVDISQVGEYPVTYTAKDAAGNSASETITLTISEKPANYHEPEEVYALAQPVYDSIITDDMSDMAKAYAIYKWVKGNIGYSGTSDKSCWTNGAYEAFTTHSGDCYTYFAAAKCLYNMAGIDNVDVIKEKPYPTSSSHFWSIINLGDGWYHVDCTRFSGGEDYMFMLTDDELAAYDSAHWRAHPYDATAYPARSTVSVQDKINYVAGTLNE